MPGDVPCPAKGFGKTFGCYDQKSAKTALICIKVYLNLVGHFSKKWLRIILNVHDVLTCRNKNLKTHLLGYLRK